MDISTLQKSIIFFLLFFAISLTGNATTRGFHSLSIENKTSNSLSFSIDGTCSEKLGSVPANGKKKISAWVTHGICDTCWVKIHESDNCTNRLLGAFLLEPSDSNVVMDVNSYQVGLVVSGGLGMLDVEWLI